MKKRKAGAGVLVWAVVLAVLVTVVKGYGMDMGGFDVQVGDGGDWEERFEWWDVPPESLPPESRWQEEIPPEQVWQEPEETWKESGQVWREPEQTWQMPQEQMPQEQMPPEQGWQGQGFQGQGQNQWQGQGWDSFYQGGQEYGGGAESVRVPTVLPAFTPTPIPAMTPPISITVPTAIPTVLPTATPVVTPTPAPTATPTPGPTMVLTPTSTPIPSPFVEQTLFTYYKKQESVSPDFKDYPVKFTYGEKNEKESNTVIEVESEGSVQILSLRVDGKECPWHWHGKQIILQVGADKGKIEILTFIRGGKLELIKL